jgi:hypothetical protein
MDMGGPKLNLEHNFTLFFIPILKNFVYVFSNAS